MDSDEDFRRAVAGVKPLKRAFGVFLALLATKMLHSLLTS